MRQMGRGREDQVFWPYFPVCSNYVLSSAVSQTPNICHASTAGWCWEKGKEEPGTVFILKKFMADKTGM